MNVIFYLENTVRIVGIKVCIGEANNKTVVWRSIKNFGIHVGTDTELPAQPHHLGGVLRSGMSCNKMLVDGLVILSKVAYSSSIN